MKRASTLLALLLALCIAITAWAEGGGIRLEIPGNAPQAAGEGAEEILEFRPGERRIRVVFNGSQTTRKPIIAGLASDEGIMASILSASTRSIGDKVYGNMLLGLTGDDGSVERALRYFTSNPDVTAREVTERAR